jgi:hypothetical protein
MKCERCRVESKGYDLHDYCAVCSKNLCDGCMAKGCCRNVPALSGMAADEPKPEPDLACPGVLDGSDIGVLNTNLQAMGVSDNDRLELLKFAQQLQTKGPSKP